MEFLIKQTRSKFSGTKEEIPPQKTPYFKDKKRSKSWLGRQLSRQKSWDYDYSGADYPTAVAAAAYAIQSLEESKSKDATYGPQKSLSKMKSKVQDAGAPFEPLQSALKSSDGTSGASFKDSDKKLPISTSTSEKIPEKVPSIKKKVSFADADEITSNKPERPPIDKSGEHAPSMTRPTISGDEQFDITGSKRPETVMPMPAHPPSGLTSHPPKTGQVPKKPGPADSTADAWEIEELASIRDRYEKTNATIGNWEMKKKKKAKRKIERIEAELDKRRAKAVRSYHSEITRIEGIAGGARAQAEENRRKEESRAKEKANKIRITGKLPPTCLCF